MAENTEIDDRVDFDDDNYSEEDSEEPMEDDGAGEGGEENGKEPQEEEVGSQDGGKEQSPGAEENDIQVEHVEDEGNPVSIKEAAKEKHSDLLDLPPHGSEVFIGGLSRDISEDDLRELCEPFGDISEVRVMKNRDTGESKGFAFVAFRTKDVAQKAIEELHSKEFKGRTLRCSLSETKYRLFIGNIPKSLTDDDFRKIIEETGPGAETLELIKDPQNPSRNRGFAFVEYYNNACADYSRQKMASGSFKLEGHTPTVTWADPKITPDHSAAAQVKALYVKNIPENATTEQLKEQFQVHGEVIKVVMPPAKSGGKRDFGFVHYSERSSALKAVKETEKYEINGQALEVVLAKPQTERRFDTTNPLNPSPIPNYIPHPGYAGSIPVSPYTSIAAGYGAPAGFQQPMIYGRGPMPAGMQMVPMVLPDGRIGYVLQQPGAQMVAPPVRPRRNDRSNGGGRGGGPSSSGDDNNNSNRNNRRYRPY